MPSPGESPAARPGFGAGVSSIFAGFGTIAKTPSLWPWALVPVLVLVALEALFITLAVKLVGPRIAHLIPAATSDWGHIGMGLLGWVAVAALAVVGWFVAVPLAPPLSAPALERIVRRVESELGMPPREPIGFLREVLCGFRAMAWALAIGAPILLVLVVIEWIAPPVVVVTVPVKYAVSSLLVAWGLFDYPLTLRGVGVRRRLDLMRKNLACVLGFGFAFMLVFWVPCCGVGLLPVGVVAATRLIADIEKHLARGGTVGAAPP
jgi:CysZ protein